MPSALRSLLAAGALALAAAGPLAAQARPDSVTLPRELLESLLGFGVRNAELVVGRLPEGFPAALVATPAEALGGTRLGPGAGIAVLRLAVAPDSAVGLLAARLRADGWAPPAARGGGPSRGFLPSSIRPGRASTLCRDDESLTVYPQPRAGGSLAHVSRTGGGSCSAEPTFYRPEERYVSFQIPALVPPADARMSFGGSGSGGSDDHQQLGTRLETALAADSLAGHYAAQLERAGWQRIGDARTADFAARMLSHRDAQGRALHAVLTVVTVPGDALRDVELRVRRVRR